MVTRDNGAASATITIPLAGMTVHAAPPRMVWIDSDEATIAAATGMRPPVFLEVLKLMEADPEHRRHVLKVSRKRRGVEVEHFVAFLRDRYAGRPDDGAAEEQIVAPPSGPDAVLAEIGATPARPERPRKGSR
jgi:hypothetical protein